jgi:hypothetical protein
MFTSDPVGVAALGLAVHFVVGFAFAWLFAQAIAVPALGLFASTLGDGAAVSPGLLSYRLGAGAALGSLASHVSYGVVVGFVYGCHGGGQCRRP